VGIYIKPDGSSAIAAKFDCVRLIAGPFRNGLARVAENGKWGYIDRYGEFVIPAQFDRALEFSEGLGLVRLDGKYGYVDTLGKIVVPPSFRRAEYFSEGLASVDTGKGEAHRSIAEAGEMGFINSSGAFIIPPQFLATGRFQNGLCLVETEKDIGYIDQSGAFIWRSKSVEIGTFDPLHLLPPENALES
jgi:hypothetical protein